MKRNNKKRHYDRNHYERINYDKLIRERNKQNEERNQQNAKLSYEESILNGTIDFQEFDPYDEGNLLAIYSIFEGQDAQIGTFFECAFKGPFFPSDKETFSKLGLKEGDIRIEIEIRLHNNIPALDAKVLETASEYFGERALLSISHEGERDLSEERIKFIEKLGFKQYDYRTFFANKNIK